MHLWASPILVIVVVGLVIGLKRLDRNPDFNGLLGESGVRFQLRRLDRTKYQTINNLIIPKNGSDTSQIDHVVIGPQGLIVIETKMRNRARIYGRGSDKQWTVTAGRKFQMGNPILQNQDHIRALRGSLGNTIPMFNVVVFNSTTDLRVTDVTDATLVHTRDVVRAITNLGNPVLSDEQVQSIYQRLTTVMDTKPDAGKRHVDRLQQSSLAREKAIRENRCPKCGAQLVEKHGKYGPFKACPRYPACKFTLSQKR